MMQENPKLGELITKTVNKRKEIPVKHWKYVDDLTLAEAIDLKKALKKANEGSPEKPLAFHERTEHKLDREESKVSKELDKLLEYSKENEIIINKEKHKVMLFNTARTRDFLPIEVVEQIKLLGVQITSDLNGTKHTQYITKRGYSKLWILRRLKRSGANQTDA